MPNLLMCHEKVSYLALLSHVLAEQFVTLEINSAIPSISDERIFKGILVQL
jgi:hypothetical protein